VARLRAHECREWHIQPSKEVIDFLVNDDRLASLHALLIASCFVVEELQTKNTIPKLSLCHVFKYDPLVPPRLDGAAHHARGRLSRLLAFRGRAGD